ncbi:hypothetical protein EHW97_04775 [Aeromicrobium camelliae]|uniref:Secreted protein n=1 Tax=Aeromicrobium camelliae TaxID=1538144 RepID=A0A3N6YGV9_9ACTN|nr:hypothetical protein [Aeromicrobium camelliae]RQN09014.1 hypothetical protein EHW97_04775 [Aeromicrobium camelliae]
MGVLSIAVRGMAVAGLVGSGLVLTAPAASAQNCSSVPGYAKRPTTVGVEYYEDARCGVDQNRITRPPATRPVSSQPTGWGCRQYPDGELCGVGIGPRPTVSLSHETWRRLYGTVRVGAPVTVRGGGGTGTGGGGGGTVSIGALSNPDKDKKVNYNTK